LSVNSPKQQPEKPPQSTGTYSQRTDLEAKEEASKWERHGQIAIYLLFDWDEIEIMIDWQ
jgi:hypothetical protein